MFLSCSPQTFAPTQELIGVFITNNETSDPLFDEWLYSIDEDLLHDRPHFRFINKQERIFSYLYFDQNYGWDISIQMPLFEGSSILETKSYISYKYGKNPPHDKWIEFYAADDANMETEYFFISLLLTDHPTPEPTIIPTIEPTMNPTDHPTSKPTVNPTIEPTQNPSTSGSTIYNDYNSDQSSNENNSGFLDIFQYISHSDDHELYLGIMGAIIISLCICICCLLWFLRNRKKKGDPDSVQISIVNSVIGNSNVSPVQDSDVSIEMRLEPKMKEYLSNESQITNLNATIEGPPNGISDLELSSDSRSGSNSNASMYGNANKKTCTTVDDNTIANDRGGSV